MYYVKPKAAIYARYSSDRQSPTSIEDQVRLCKELAHQLGYEVPDHLVFADRAVTGKKEGLNAREAFASLKGVVKSGEVDCVVIDEISRAGRDALTLVTFVDELNERNVRLLVKSTGLDSQAPFFMMYFSMMMGLATQESEQTKLRTSRGMLGVLERGGMVGYPPYGYSLVPRVEGDSGRGATFQVEPAEASLVVKMFELRKSGKSYYAIASYMQSLGVPIPGKRHKPEGGYWRANTVKQLLSNTLYKGVFTWNGSSYAKAKAKKKNKALVTRQFERPTLQILDAQLWESVQAHPGENPRKGYKHAYTRRVICGVCGNSCSLVYRKNGTMLSCAVCEQRRRLLKDTNFYCQSSVRALDVVIRDALSLLDSEEVLSEYQSQLLGLINKDSNEDELEIQRQLDSLAKRVAVISKLLARNHGDIMALDASYESIMRETKQLQGRLEVIKTARVNVTPDAIDMHIESLTPQWYLDELFDKVIEPEQANELIGRIFPKIVFAKESKNFSLWSVTVNLAELALSEELVPMPSVGFIHLKYRVECVRKSPTHYLPSLIEKVVGSSLSSI